MIPQKLKTNFRLIAIRDRLGFSGPAYSDEKHLETTVAWLKRAQDATSDGGVSAGYYDYCGWETSYPETTGYIIPTMFDYSHFAHDDDCLKRALRMGDFLMNSQLTDGSFLLGFVGAPHDPDVFDTGQCIQGLTRCYRETKRDEYLLSAIKAADWIVAAQDKDGSWRKYSFNGIPHTYYTRVAFPLLDLYSITEDRKYQVAAVKNVEWAVANCNEAGWYENCAFDTKSMPHPNSHVIAYTAEGILKCGIMLDNNNFIRTATKTMSNLLRKFNTEGRIRGTYNKKWESADKYSCLTGDAQIAAIWLNLFELTEDRAYYLAADMLSHYIKTTQFLKHSNKGIEGGIKGSQPIYGDYNPNSFPSWAAKFFIDLLLLRATVHDSHSGFATDA